MKIFVERLDMKKTRERWPEGVPFEPALVRPVEAVGGSSWYVLDAAYMPGEQPVWSFSAHDEYLRVPVFSYDMRPQADLAMAFMLQLGLACAGYLPGKVSHFYVVTGNPVELLYDSETGDHAGLRFWFGFAVRLL